MTVVNSSWFIFFSVCLGVVWGQCGDDTALQTDFDTSATGVLALVKQTTWDAFWSQAVTAAACTAPAIYNREALNTAVTDMTASRYFIAGDYQMDSRDLVAFLAFVSSATTGWWSTAPCGPAYWGLCRSRLQKCDDETSADCPAVNNQPCNAGYACAGVEGKKYYGRGPMMLEGNANYAAFGNDVFGDSTKFLNAPELLETDAVIGWKSALWLYNRNSFAGQPTAHQFMQGDKATNYQFQSGFGGAMSVMGGICPSACDGTSESYKKVTESYRRFATMMGAKLCGIPTEWVICAGTKFPRAADSDCSGVVNECETSNVGSYPEGYPIVDGSESTSTEAAGGGGGVGTSTGAPSSTDSTGAGTASTGTGTDTTTISPSGTDSTTPGVPPGSGVLPVFTSVLLISLLACFV